MKATPDQAARLEKKLDMIITHFSIGDSVPRSPVELMELARKKEEARQARALRRERKSKLVLCGQGQ